MNRTALIFLAMILVVSSGAAAAKNEKTDTIMSQWLKSIQRKVEQLAPKKTVNMTTGVAGVRGARDNAQAKLYWKGASGGEPVGEAELQEFKTAIGHAADGESVAAQTELETFMVQYPDSPLIPDAKKTLDLVKAELQEEDKPNAEEKTDKK